MITIAKVKMDNRGRITLPSSFIHANRIQACSEVIIKPKYNSRNEVILEFLYEETME